MGKARALRIQKPANDVDDSLMAQHPTDLKKPSERSKGRVEEIAAEIAKTAMPRRTAIHWIMDRYQIAETTAINYYTAVMRYLRPSDPQAYREELISRNFATLEEMLQTALKKGDLKNAVAIIRTQNAMCGVGSNKVEIKRDGMESGQTETITISFA